MLENVWVLYVPICVCTYDFITYDFIYMISGILKEILNFYSTSNWFTFLIIHVLSNKLIKLGLNKK